MSGRELSAHIVTQFSECRYKEPMKPLDWLQWQISQELSTRDDRIHDLEVILRALHGECTASDFNEHWDSYIAAGNIVSGLNT